MAQNIADSIAETTLFKAIRGYVTHIMDTLYEIRDTFVNSWDNILDFVLNFPSRIIDTIKSIFIPDADEIKNDLLGLVDSVSHTFNLGIDSADWLIDSFTEEAIPDQTGSYNIPGVGVFNLTFFDSSFLKQGVEFFRPIIRGFVVLMLIFYNYRQLLSFIGQDPGMWQSAKIKSEGGKEQ